jgi:hypothetical protein
MDGISGEVSAYVDSNFRLEIFSIFIGIRI